MQKITKSELKEKIAALRGAAPVGILAVTDARARKTGNPFGAIQKTVRCVGWVGARYAGSVERQMGREGVEGSFEASPLPWGEWDVPGKVIRHKGSFYLRTQSTPGTRRKAPARVLRYDCESGELTREQVAPFLPAKTESRKQAEAGLEAENQIQVSTYSFDSIKRIRLGGQTYEIEN
jgi:hypothetical protein